MTSASADASFEQLRKHAKRWLRALRAGDPTAVARLQRVLPRHTQNPGLREVQQALARELGFDSWAALKEQRAIDSVAARGDGALVAEFLERACIFSSAERDFPHKWRRAERIRVQHPTIATATLHTAVVCGDLDHVRKLLVRDPSLAKLRGGPQDWEPLLFVCYGRLPNQSAADNAMAIAELLLDAGADPNTHFISRDEWRLRFTALTGAMGGGEMGQPEHPHGERLAHLLLRRGADPNDGQGLYNTHLVDDDPRWLKLLIGYGLSKEHRVNWHADAAAAATAALQNPHTNLRILDYLAAQAAANGHTRRLTCLLERGADPNARSNYDGRSCYQSALLAGRREVAELLLAHGARPEPLEGADAFIAACMAGDEPAARAALDGHPEYRDAPDALIRAAQRGDARSVKLMLELGFDPNRAGKHGHRALNVSSGDRVLVDLLLQHGADPRARSFGGTPAGWARLGGDLAMARHLASQSRLLLDAVAAGAVELAAELLAQNPGCIEERAPGGRTALHALPDDPEQARAMIDLLLAHGADPDAADEAGRSAPQALERAGLDEVADLLEAAWAAAKA